MAKAKIFCMFCGRLVFVCSVSFTFVSVTTRVNRVQCENKDLHFNEVSSAGKKGYKVLR